MIQAYKVAVTTLIILVIILMGIVFGRDGEPRDKGMAFAFAALYVAAAVGMWL